MTHPRPAVPRLLAISPPDAAGALRWSDEAPSLVAAGVDGLLLRVLDSPFDTESVIRPLLALDVALLLHLRTPGGLELADRLSLGLHLPDGVDPRPFRDRIPGLLGQSRHDGPGLAASAAQGCDYATIGPVARPVSKPDDLRRPLGVEGVLEVLGALAGPERAGQSVRRAPGAREPRGFRVLALGGLDPALAAACLRAGCWGVAGLGALATPDGVRSLRGAFE